MLPRMAALWLPLILLTAPVAAQLPAPGDPLPQRSWERSEVTLVAGTGLPVPEALQRPIASQGTVSQSQNRTSVVASNAGVITVHSPKKELPLPAVSEAWPASAPPRPSKLKEPVAAPPATDAPLATIPPRSTAPALGLLEIPKEPPLVHPQAAPAPEIPAWQNLSFEEQQAPSSTIPADPGMVSSNDWGQEVSFDDSSMFTSQTAPSQPFATQVPEAQFEQAWETEAAWDGNTFEDPFWDQNPGCTQCGCDPYGNQLYHEQNSSQQNWCPQPDAHGKFLPFGNLGPKFGNRRVISSGEFFIPVWQDSGSLIFTDFKGAVDDHNSGNGYFGFGYRTFFNPYWIFGTYLYADVIGTNQQNIFAQAQFGLELMTLNWDFRINGYGPSSGGASAHTMSGISNGTVVTRSFRERAYQGFDFEFGRRLLHWGWNDRFELRGFIGGYQFGASATSFPSFSGPRGRLEMRIYDLGWLGEQSRLEFGVEASYDRVRDDQYYGYFRLRIPFGKKAGRPVLDPLRRRLVDTPVHSVN